MARETVKPGKNFDLERIKSILPHRDPFLLIDSVDEIVDTTPGTKKGRKIYSTKKITGMSSILEDISQVIPLCLECLW
jgi:3-hydroxymyristoyl/3-hydroxydecanoyl-(acyl carrier protein) dehydratase